MWRRRCIRGISSGGIEVYQADDKMINNMLIQTSQNNKRIAKNTMLLYVRMLFSMLISLYTSRIILQTLGIEDYGIYNVVGGIVAMFSIFSGSLSAAISRFLTYELGIGDIIKLTNMFSSAVTIQMGLSLIIIIFAESLGLWFLNTKMNIPEERVIAANWVFQLSIMTFVFGLISVPYNAAIIAHEKMSAFAYIGIFEVSAKLLAVCLLQFLSYDKLILFATLMAIIAIIIRLMYGYYCKKHFKECNYSFNYDSKVLKKMFSFAGWNFIGASSALLRDTGGNIVMNLFCGPAVNAARGIAMQVSNAVSGFSNNFMTAINPQITKSYAADDKPYMMMLIYQGARLSFYMLLLLSLPIIINAHYILTIWLNVVPEHSVAFVRLVLIFIMSESISNPLITAMLATGNIRNYQIVVGGLQMMNLPISYLLLRIGYIPESVLIVAIIISQLCLITRLFMLRNMIGLSVRVYLNKVYINIIIVTLISAVIPSLIFFSLDESFMGFVFVTTISLISTSSVIFYVGCSKNERLFVVRKVKNIIGRKLREQVNDRN